MKLLLQTFDLLTVEVVWEIVPVSSAHARWFPACMSYAFVKLHGLTVL